MQTFNPKNEHIKIYVGGEILPRSEAKVSVFDSIVQGGDGVWEGLRVYDGRIFCLEDHLDRLHASAKAMAFTDVPDREFIKQAIFDTLKANDMRDGVHIRMTLSRGLKTTSGMDPRLNQFGATLIIVAEWKPPIYDEGGIRLVTSSIRRNGPNYLDSKIHHNNLINNILAKVEANFAGVDDALMLDGDGFVSETNATNVFMVRKGVLMTPLPEACLPGITRKLVMEIARTNGIMLEERRISLSEFHAADEMFTTGTMGELSPVLELDGRTIGTGEVGTLTQQIQALYRARTATMGTHIPAWVNG
ncbi:aminotransferase class IV [Pontibacter sp. G13]|uniref:aminotransferase class IV n=1 Tax=Pontibacter sp. G13 TaxID=3074898 RepID=UPI0028897CC0|nr:aminotransferase class IV [Pontibacter sp. G13]WNJ20920.1 aminotransferase class IV [Pontibacter sp. G13]